MRQKGERLDYWKPASFLLWLLFFAAGLVPEWAFYYLRGVSGVVTQLALTNSPYFITVGFSAYWGFFCYSKCRQAGRPPADASASSMQLALIALVAFLPFPLELLVQAREIPVAQTRHLIYLVGFVKLLSWWYSFMLMFYYHLSGNPAVFCRSSWLFPSAHPRVKPESRTEVSAPPSECAQTHLPEGLAPEPSPTPIDESGTGSPRDKA